MERITLEEYLLDNGTISSGMVGKSKLIDKLEIYGFVNACKDEDMYKEYWGGTFYPNGFVNKETSRQIVLSGFLCQVTDNYYDKEITQTQRCIPVFDSVRISDSEDDYGVEDIHIPSLVGNKLYRQIKERYGHGKNVTDNELRKHDFPSNITVLDGKAVFHAAEGHIQLLDKNGKVKSIGENILAVCRYIHEATGALRYTQFNLDEITLDDIH